MIKESNCARTLVETINVQLTKKHLYLLPLLGLKLLDRRKERKHAAPRTDRIFQLSELTLSAN